MKRLILIKPAVGTRANSKPGAKERGKKDKNTVEQNNFGHQNGKIHYVHRFPDANSADAMDKPAPTRPPQKHYPVRGRMKHARIDTASGPKVKTTSRLKTRCRATASFSAYPGCVQAYYWKPGQRYAESTVANTPIQPTFKSCELLASKISQVEYFSIH